MPSFATAQQFADHMQTPLASLNAAAITLSLEAATARIQSETGQHLFYVADDTLTIRGYSGRIFLPEQPVVSVSTVITKWIGDAEIMTRTVNLDYESWGNELIWTAGQYLRLNASPRWNTYGNDWPEFVTVTYSHGYQTMPADITECCLQLAAESYSSPDGVGYESIDDYAWRRGDAEKTPGALALKALAKRYGQRSRMVGVR